jgi:hypothetical protein
MAALMGNAQSRRFKGSLAIFLNECRFGINKRRDADQAKRNEPMPAKAPIKPKSNALFLSAVMRNKQEPIHEARKK